MHCHSDGCDHVPKGDHDVRHRLIDVPQWVAVVEAVALPAHEAVGEAPGEISQVPDDEHGDDQAGDAGCTAGEVGLRIVAGRLIGGVGHLIHASERDC